MTCTSTPQKTDSAARAKWLDTLRKVRELRIPSVVIPGHSKIGAPLDASTAVDFTEKYLLAFEEELNTAKDLDGLIYAMKARFPSADVLLALERGAKANVTSAGKQTEGLVDRACSAEGGCHARSTVTLERRTKGRCNNCKSANAEIQDRCAWMTTKTRRLRAPIGRCCATERILPYFRTTLPIQTPWSSGCCLLTSSASCASGTPLPRGIMSAFPNLKLIASTGPVNTSIDVAAAGDHGDRQ